MMCEPLLGDITTGTCMTLVHFTGAVVWDSIGSICVGGLMGATAWFLISRNRQMLIGGLAGGVLCCRYYLTV